MWGASPCKLFQNWFQRSYFLGFQRPKFLWVKDSLLEHIDRYFGNKKLLEMFSNRVFLHLPQFYLDHRPLCWPSNPVANHQRRNPSDFSMRR